MKDLSAIEINNENWTVRAVSVESSKKRSNGQNDAQLVNKVYISRNLSIAETGINWSEFAFFHMMS